MENLNQLSIQELKNLNREVVAMIKHKVRVAGSLNAQKLRIGMNVKYTGHLDLRISGHEFKIERLGSVNAKCRDLKTGLGWNINLANISPIN